MPHQVQDLKKSATAASIAPERTASSKAPTSGATLAEQVLVLRILTNVFAHVAVGGRRNQLDSDSLEDASAGII